MSFTGYCWLITGCKGVAKKQQTKKRGRGVLKSTVQVYFMGGCRMLWLPPSKSRACFQMSRVHPTQNMHKMWNKFKPRGKDSICAVNSHKQASEDAGDTLVNTLKKKWDRFWKTFPHCTVWTCVNNSAKHKVKNTKVWSERQCVLVWDASVVYTLVEEELKEVIFFFFKLVAKELIVFLAMT